MRRSLHALLAVAAASAVAAPTARAQVTWFTHDGHEYGLSEAPMTWQAAQAASHTLGAYLASVGSGSENDFLVARFATIGPGMGRDVWIGLFLDPTSSLWVWDSGEPVGYTNWSPGEPNDEGGSEDAVHIRGVEADWNDLVSGNELHAIFERPASLNVVPEPATLLLTATGLCAVGAIVRRRRA